LVYGAKVWQIPAREMNKILCTEMNVLRRPARKSRMERIKKGHTKEIMGVKGKLDIIDKKRQQWYGHIKKMPEERKPKLIMDWIPLARRKKRTSKKNVVRSTSSLDNKKFRTRSMEKQRGMAFGFQKMATAVIKLDR